MCARTCVRARAACGAVQGAMCVQPPAVRQRSPQPHGAAPLVRHHQCGPVPAATAGIVVVVDVVGELTEAKAQGILHEKLLDRREKMKADRYCK